MFDIEASKNVRLSCNLKNQKSLTLRLYSESTNPEPHQSRYVDFPNCHSPNMDFTKSPWSGTGIHPSGAYLSELIIWDRQIWEIDVVRIMTIWISAFGK